MGDDISLRILQKVVEMQNVVQNVKVEVQNVRVEIPSRFVVIYPDTRTIKGRLFEHLCLAEALGRRLRSKQKQVKTTI